MRYAEVILIAAEAADNLGGQDAEAALGINKSGERAGTQLGMVHR
jgi:hypothetical protein